MKSCLVCERLLEKISGDALGLNNTSNYYNANSGMELANVLHEFNNRLTGINHRVYQDDYKLSL